ncbi:MAG: peptide chain release factor-like protein [Planctomycetales bacterium]|nr:peptide chain release factor-like protein [Planctomycetales bacterium]
MPLPRSDIVVQFLRGSGPGGSNRNKVVTGVRVRHVPTGLVAMATERRSQARNLAIALDRLEERVGEHARPKVPRVATAPTAGARRRRIEAKRRRGARKAARRPAGPLDAGE